VTSLPATVLVIDDAPPIRRLLKTILVVDDFRILLAARAKEGLMYLRHDRPDVVLLDLGLPDREGMELIPEIRELSSVPIVVLTARHDEREKVKALDLGADDYVTKPFGAEELLARIRTAFRHRVQMQGGAPNVRAGAVEIGLVHRRMRRCGAEVRLSPREYDLLARLAIHAGKVLTQLLEAVWGDRAADPQYLRVYIRQLRQKLEAEPDRPELIVTEPGVGYRLCEA
jgi:two-component system KDP operon response regulator KdpE